MSPSGQPANDWPLGRFRAYLRLLAQTELDSRFQAKVDPSDIVQDTLLKAVANIEQFRGKSEAELAGWLRQILANTLAKTIRNLKRQKRDLRRERSIEAALEETSARMDLLPVEKESVSPERALERLELWLQVSEALVALPEGQRQAVSLYHLRGWTIAQICAHLDRSEASVVSLIHRGLKTLRKELKEND